MGEHEKLQKATTADIVICVLLPGWGGVIGLIALLKGEGRRGATMIAIDLVVHALAFALLSAT